MDAFGGAPDARWSGVTGNDRFFFRRARISVAGAFAEHFDFKAELDLQAGLVTQQELLRQQAEFERRRYAIEREALVMRQALLALLENAQIVCVSST